MNNVAAVIQVGCLFILTRDVVIGEITIPAGSFVRKDGDVLYLGMLTCKLSMM